MYKQYKRKGIAEAKPWTEQTSMTNVSVSHEDKTNGSPKLGDMIAHNPSNHDDMWLIAKEYFESNFEEC